MKHASILGTIGRTPVVKLSKLAPPHVSLYAKVESFNPMGSIKDRLALAVIEHAERTGDLKPGQTVVEATSGNTGIGLAMVCARKGHPLVIVMAENFSIERRRLLRFLGASVVLTPAAQKGSGMLAKAMELAETFGWFLPRQFENEANAAIHFETRAREIISDFAGERLDYFVSTFGTGGTLKGVARALRAGRPETCIIVAEPDNSPMLASGVAQPAAVGVAPASHPAFRPHPIQGTSPDFIPKLAADAIAMGLVDEIEPVNGGEAMRMSRELALQEGIFAGISAGAALAAGLQVARRAPAGSSILCMLPDTGERYLSTPLFEDIPVDMTAAEEAISRSTPLCQFDAPAPVAPSAPSPFAQESDAEARAFVDAAITDLEQPVVLFALEWCEFCWSVRRLLTALSIPFRAIDLDSVRFQDADLGGRIRRALNELTGVTTIPQVFISGAFAGGCTDVFAATQSGELRQRLQAAGLRPESSVGIDLQSLMPKWVRSGRPASRTP